MRNPGLVLSFACLLVLSGSISAARAADTGEDVQSDQPYGHFGPAMSSFAAPAAGGGSSSLPRFGLGVKVSVLLGIGIEAATSVTQKTNVRGGFNFFGYTLTGTDSKTQLAYSGNLHLRSADVMFDWFPFGGGFHLSPGLMLYNGNEVKATVSEPGGQKITLNHVDYYSSASVPITGTVVGDLHPNAVAPMALFGWGNLLRRKGGHFSVNFEAGVVFTGSPTVSLNLAGNACDINGHNCVNVATDPGVQSNIKAQQKTANDDVNFLKVFPVISVGAGWRF